MLCFDKCGAKETRTPDPLHAMQMLYQLSYSPIFVGVIIGKKMFISNSFYVF